MFSSAVFASMVLVMSAIGAAIGIYLAGMSFLGVFSDPKIKIIKLVVFVGMPLVQLFYGMILMNKILEIESLSLEKAGACLVIGLSIAACAIVQGRVCAKCCDACNKHEEGFGSAIMLAGISESVGLFVAIFALNCIDKF